MENRILLMVILGLQCVVMSLIILSTPWQWAWTILALLVFGSAAKMMLNERSSTVSDPEEET